MAALARRLPAPTAPAAAWAWAATLGALALVLALHGFFTSIAWVDRVFPGFVLLDNRVVATVGFPTWSGATIPDLHWHQVTAVDGTPVSSAAAVYEHVATLPPGTPVTYSLLRHGRERTVAVPTQRFTLYEWTLLFLPFLFNGVTTIGCGLAVWILGPRRPVSRAFLCLGTINGLFFLGTVDWYGPARFGRLACTMEGLLAGGVVQLALLFPERSRFVRARFAGFALTVPLVVARLADYADVDTFTRLTAWIYASTGAAALLLIARCARTYWGAGTLLARQRARLVGVGAALGIALPGLILAVTALTTDRLPSNLGAFFPLIFVIAVGYAIVQHDLFEIDAMVKRATFYLILTGVVAATYLAAMLAFHQLLRAGLVSDSPLLPVIFTLVVLFLINPLRTRLQTLVDRVFFGTQYDGAEVLAAVGGRLVSALTRDEIADLIGSTVRETLGARFVRLVDQVPPGLRPWLESGRVITVADPLEQYRDADAHGLVRRTLADLGADLAVPIRRAGEAAGALLVGQRPSGLFYTSTDAEFLRALAQAATIALQNARSYEALAELNAGLEEQVRERTAQLVQSEKMASLGRLVAGVAHEINNPLAAVAGSVEPLREQIEETAEQAPDALRPALGKAKALLDVMARGAERTATIVKALRAYSRTDEESRRPVDVNEKIEECLRLLKARWDDRIRIHREYGDLPAVRCAAGQIGQVLLNLLANACDAIDAGGNIWISTLRRGDAVQVTIRDDGRGMSPEVAQRIFDPFFTTKDVGQGTGLGLAISQRIVAAHGGRLSVTSAPGKGASFELVLPIVAKERETTDSRGYF